MRKTIVLIAMFLVLTAGAAFAAEYALVVNPGNPVGTLSKQVGKDIFLGRKSAWDNGSRVTIYAQSGASFHSLVVKNVTGKNAGQFDLFWKKALFTGQGIPPTNLSGDAAVKQAVAGNPGAVCYISADAVDSSVKVLEIR